MRSLIAAVVLTVACFTTSGCGAIGRLDDALYDAGLDTEPSAARAVAKDAGVTVLAGDRKGRGAIVGPRTVLTVAHVVGTETKVEVATSGLAWTTAHVVARIAASPEDVIVLELETSTGLFGFEGFAADRRLETAGAGATPAWVLAATGTHGWARGLRPGDSGSPVIDTQGALVGVLVGVTTQGRGVVSRVAPAATTPSAPETFVARLSTRR